jgi:hypothetical protein
VGLRVSEWRITAVQNVGLVSLDVKEVEIKDSIALRVTYVDSDAQDDSNVNNDLQELSMDTVEPGGLIDLRVWLEPTS